MNYVNPSEMGTPIAHYSHGVVAGDLVFVSGEIALDQDGNLVGAGDLVAQTRQALANVEAVLKAAGCNLSDVVSTTVYLKNFDNYREYDRAYGEAFGDHKPARATIRADLVRNEWLVEVQAIAKRDSG